MSSNELNILNHALSKLDRIFRAARWLVLMTASAVLWGARLEWKNGDHEYRLAKIETTDEKFRDETVRFLNQVEKVQAVMGEQIRKLNLLSDRMDRNNP